AHAARDRAYLAPILAVKGRHARHVAYGVVHGDCAIAVLARDECGGKVAAQSRGHLRLVQLATDRIEAAGRADDPRQLRLETADPHLVTDICRLADVELAI